MATKKVAFFNESPTDVFVSFVSNSVTYYPEVACSSLPAESSLSSPNVAGEWFQADDADSVLDACAVVTDVAGPMAIATFERADSSTYQKGANPFVSGGSHPPTRPH